MLSWLRKLGKSSAADRIRGTPQTVGKGGFGFEIVGEASYQDRLRQISAGRCEAGERNVTFLCHLRYEINDRNHLPAVRVDASGGRTVGYFPAEQAVVYAPMLRTFEESGRTADCLGVLVGGYGQKPTLGVYLDFKPNLLR